MITDKKLDQWIASGVNVLIEGQHGVGKSERVIQAMQRNGKKFLYFSASTMDPFVDFIGVPRVVEDSKNNKRWLEFIKPLALQADDIEYLIFDEYNRAPKKVRNATMEILQFKSINGLAIPNLKAIWAMINPSDENDTYDVEQMDAAQKDRFQIQVSFPTKPDPLYFEDKYGHAGKIACEWWKAMPSAEIKKNTVSPRRLSYTLDAWKAGLDISDLLPNSVNVAQLKTELNSIGLYSRLEEFKKMSVAEIQEENKVTNVRNFILAEVKKKTLPITHLNAFSAEQLAHMLSEDYSVEFEDVFLKRMLDDSKFADFVVSLVSKSKVTRQVTFGKKVLTKYDAEIKRQQQMKILSQMHADFKPTDRFKNINEVLDFLKNLEYSKIQSAKLLEEMQEVNKIWPIFDTEINQIKLAIRPNEVPAVDDTQSKNKVKKKKTLPDTSLVDNWISMDWSTAEEW